MPSVDTTDTPAVPNDFAIRRKQVFVYDLTTGQAPAAVGDVTPPVVTLVSPAEGAVTLSTPVVLTVTDETGLRRVILGVRLSIGMTLAVDGVEEKYEVIHDGTIWGPGYSSYPSAVTVNAPGNYGYVVLRQNGWPKGPMKFKVFPFDTGGNEDV